MCGEVSLSSRSTVDGGEFSVYALHGDYGDGYEVCIQDSVHGRERRLLGVICWPVFSPGDSGFGSTIIDLKISPGKVTLLIDGKHSAEIVGLDLGRKVMAAAGGIISGMREFQVTRAVGDCGYGFDGRGIDDGRCVILTAVKAAVREAGLLM